MRASVVNNPELDMRHFSWGKPQGLGISLLYEQRNTSFSSTIYKGRNSMKRFTIIIAAAAAIFASGILSARAQAPNVQVAAKTQAAPKAKAGPRVKVTRAHHYRVAVRPVYRHHHYRVTMRPVYRHHHYRVAVRRGHRHHYD